MSEGRGRVRRQMTGWMHEKTKAEWAEQASKDQIEIERLRAALREIAACPQKRHRADGDVDVYYNGATMLKIAKEALGDE